MVKCFVVDQNLAGQISVSWGGTCSVEDWLDNQPHQSWKQAFEKHGVLVSFIFTLWFELCVLLWILMTSLDN